LAEFGGGLLADGQVKAAIQVFRLNAAAYPASPRAREDLKVAQAADGPNSSPQTSKP
jgi:hypothetical protein